MITLSVENLGPIAKASVELRPLTIFVGPSNTGKSYMATAVHALTKAVADGSLPMLFGGASGGFTGRGFQSNSETNEDEEFAEALTTLREFAGQLIRDRSDPSKLTVSDLPPIVRSWLDEFTLQQLESFKDDVVDRLRQIHGEESRFVSRGRATEDFRLTIRQEEPPLNMEMRLSDDLKPLPEFDLSRAAIPSMVLELASPRIARDEDIWTGSEIASVLAASISHGAFEGVPSQSYYLPAARSGIVQGHKVLSAALVRQSSSKGIRRLSIPTLPVITTEFLSHLISLDRRSSRPERHPDLDKAISFIENNVLHGTIALDDSAGLPYPEIMYQPVGDEPPLGKFPLEHTSSMVSELAPLILFLKHLVGKGDLLIIEEPESHLHPAAQLQMARGIARLVNAGVQVLVTTHSSDFMGQIDNLISLSNVSETTADSVGLAQEECLHPEQVSAYGFRVDSSLGGSVVHSLPVGSDVGIEDAEFLSVSESLYEQAITLQRRRRE